MATNTLVNRSSGQTITEDFFNDFNSALQGDVVGRNASGVPEAGQSLGTAAFPWGTARIDGLVVGGNSIDVSAVSAPPYRIQSGKTRATSNQPAFIEPNGASNEFTISAASDSLTYDVNASTVTLSSDIVVGSLSVAPSTNNTCLVDMAEAIDQAESRQFGELDGEQKTITVDAMGSEITALIGTVQAFSLNDGANDEYFIARVKSATELTECFRGFFYDSSSLPVNRLAFADNDTITLLRLGYIFLDSDAVTADVTYTEPSYSFSAPSSPGTGDYWYDLGNNLWKRYDGATFNTVTRTFIGWCVMDDTNCLGARCVDFDARYKPNIGMPVDKETSEIVSAKKLQCMVDVAGNEIQFVSKPSWNITNDLAPNVDMYDATEQADRFYFLYITDEGQEIISDIEPYRRDDLKGWYHPHNPWRMVGSFYNDASSDIQFATNDFESDRNGSKIHGYYISTSGQSVPYNVTTVLEFDETRSESNDSFVSGSGTSFVLTAPASGVYQVSGSWDVPSGVASGANRVFLNDALTIDSQGPGPGSKFNQLGRDCADTASSRSWKANGSLDLYLHRGNSLSITAYQNLQASNAVTTEATVRTYMSITYKGNY